MDRKIKEIMNQMKVSDYILNFLKGIGTKNVFVVTGAAIADLIDSFSRIDDINYVAMVHEQGATFAAETLTKVSGELGVTMVTSGPGGTNLVTGIANCWYDSIPNLFITGQINSAFLRSDLSIRQVGFQENDIVSIVKPITKYAKLITDARDIRKILEEAVYLANEGRPGPVLIDIPMNIQRQVIDIDSLVGFEVPENNFILEEELLDSIIEKLNISERPVLLVGGGVRLSNAIDELRNLAEMLRIPCFPTWNALDIIDSENEFYGGRIGTYGGPGRNFAIQNSDLLLSIGCRMSGRITGGVVESFARNAFKIIIDIDEANVSILQTVKGDYNIKCDAKFFIQALINRIKDYNKLILNSHELWLLKTKEWCKKYDPAIIEHNVIDNTVNPYIFMSELSKVASKNAVIVADCGGNIVVTSQAFKTKKDQRLCSSNGNSPMGYSFAGAIGAYFADPTRQIICIIGDGGFTMNIQELQTIKNYNIPIKTFILNNHVYGIIKAFQDTNLEGRYLASGPDGYKPPDFIRISNAYDVDTKLIENSDELIDGIKFVLDFDGPIVCDVNMNEFFTYQPRIFGWKTPIEDMYPYLDREEFKNNMIIEPMEDWRTPIIPKIN